MFGWAVFPRMKERYPLLARIDSPADLRALPVKDLPQVAAELREYLLHSVAQVGGHFAAGMGVVELTVATHYVFDTPHDRVVWDVGHQCYPHKILTGRRDRIATIRRRGGLAPFPTPEESEYDAFAVGHSSTSISAALGMALAARSQGIERKCVAIIGDGAMTAGMAFEALNHLGDAYADVLVILNDNEMSISPNVGALSNYLTRILSGRVYSSVREGGKKILRQMPPMWELARRTEEHVKGMVAPGTLFEEMGLNYFGPVDGHDVVSLAHTLQNLRAHKGPRLLHVVTRKGKGYEPAESDPVGYHAVPIFDPERGVSKPGRKQAVSYTRVFSDWVCDMAAQDPQLVAITPAMREGSGLVAFHEAYPERYFDVGIAEQHAVTLAGGMARDGLHPVVAIYSTFLQRAYDQLIHDVALPDLPVLFAIDRAGVVGPDGPTHAGSFDLSYLRCIPNLVVMCPSDENQCRQMLYTGFLHQGPAAVRYPRGTGPGAEIQQAMEALPIGRGEIVRRGRSGVAILAFGSPVAAALEAAEELDATVADMRFVKPLDERLIRQLAGGHDLLVTAEDNVVAGGAGSAVSEYLARAGLSVPVLHLGLPDRFMAHGSRDELLREAGLDAAGITRSILERWTPRDCAPPRSHVLS